MGITTHAQFHDYLITSAIERYLSLCHKQGGSPGSVLAVCADFKEALSFRKFGFKNILVPIDLSEKCETALLYAMALAEQCAARITAIYALRLDMFAQDIPAGALDIVIKQSVSELGKTVERIKKKYKGSKKLSIKTEVVHGLSPAYTVSNYAEQKGTDLIVIHTHGRTGIKRLILGNVTERIVNHVSCTVLALRPS